MIDIAWQLVEVASQLLGRDEREAVLGDLFEAGESAWQVVLAVFGLVVRRQTILWKGWRPWLAAFGLALPGSFLLMGSSVSVSWSCQHIAGPGASTSFLLLISQIFLLVSWSWIGGFVVGSVSPPTLWVSIASSFLPCLFCLARFRESSLPRLCLLLFLAPATWGVLKGLRTTRIRLRPAVALAVAVTVLTFYRWDEGLWTIDWVLIWPAWYLVATAWTTGREPVPN